MLTKFFGANVYRVDNLSDMFLPVKELAKILNVKDRTIRRMIEQCQEARVLSLPRGGQGQPTKDLRNIYTLKTLLTLLFSTHPEYTSEHNTKVREWVCTVVNNLCFDEFVSLYGYRLDEHCRRAIMTAVCGYTSHKDIVLKRFDFNVEYCNTILRGSKYSRLLYAKLPEAYIDRDEVKKVKAIDLAVFLLTKYLLKESPQEFLACLGIPVSYGDFTEEDEQVIIKHLSKYYKKGNLIKRSEK